MIVHTAACLLTSAMRVVLHSFATSYICLARLEKVRKALETVVLDESYTEFVRRQQGAEAKGKANDIKRWVLDDLFWEKVRGVLKLFERPWL